MLRKNKNTPNRYYSLILLISLMVLLSGCQLLSVFDFFSDNSSSEKDSKKSKPVETIYVQSITGQQLETVKQIFFQTIREQKEFSFVELLPESLNNVAVLRLEILDYTIWENEESREDEAAEQDATPDTFIRRNANVRIKVSLFNAETGEPLIRSIYSQPYQQIYVEDETKQNRADKERELHRLLNVLLFRILASIYQDQDADDMMEFESGRGYNLISDWVYDLGDRRLKKGIRLAESGEYDQAKWIWQIILYSPADDEPKDIYISNRASAYYNLGQLYRRDGNWLEAAKMFSYANRLQQKRRYAHAWGESMQSWLEAKKEPPPKKTAGRSQKVSMASMRKEMPRDEGRKKPELILDLEINNRLLLKAKELWPLDPDIKQLPSE